MKKLLSILVMLSIISMPFCNIKMDAGVYDNQLVNIGEAAVKPDICDSDSNSEEDVSTNGKANDINNEDMGYAPQGYEEDSSSVRRQVFEKSGKTPTYPVTYTPNANVSATLTEDGTLTISLASGAQSTELPAFSGFSYSSLVKKIVIEDGFTSITSMAFVEYLNVTTVNVPSSVTEIKYAAFADCTSLSSVTGLEGVQSVGKYAFQATAITSISFSSALQAFDSNAFYACSKINSIVVDSSNSTFKTVDGVLYSKDQTKLLYYPSGKTDTSFSIPSTVNTIGEYAFTCQNYISQLTIPEGVTTLCVGSFYQMTALLDITLPSSITGQALYSYVYGSFTAHDVKYLNSNIFRGCKSLRTAVLNGDYNLLSNSMFQDCTSLSSVIINAPVKTIGGDVFSQCSNLSSISFTAGTLANVLPAFSGCTKLTDFDFSTVSMIYKDAFSGSGITVDKYSANFDKSSDGSYVRVVKLTITGDINYDKAYEVLDLVNAERQKLGLSKLEMNQELLDAAMLRASEISIDFAHTRPSGLSCFTASSLMFGENIAAGSSTAAGVMNQWMNSQGHKDNILQSSFNCIGIGCFTINGMTYWTQCFGNTTSTSAIKPSNKTITVDISVLSDNLTSSSLKWDKTSYSFGSTPVTTRVRLINRGWTVVSVPLDSSELTFSSDNPAVAMVSSTGVVTSVSSGTFTLTASLKDLPLASITYVGTVNIPSQTSDTSSTSASSSSTELTSQTAPTDASTSNTEPVTIETSATQPTVAQPSETPTTPTTPTTAAPNLADFVERLYTVALGRPSDSAGKADWISRVYYQNYTGADVARGFLFSQEFLGKNSTNDVFVETLYMTFFNRPSDASGKADWVNRLNSGTSRMDVINGFIGSIEWANLCLTYGVDGGGGAVPTITVQASSNVTSFATRLYSTCLNRTPDPQGLSNWSSSLANRKVSGSNAAYGFFFSAEFISLNTSDEEYVTRLYRTFLGREPDASGFRGWVDNLANGASREEVFYGFANSQEFAGICASYGIVR